MASIQSRTSRGKKYWSIVESRRINGKPRSIILEYLGTPETLLKKLQNESSLKLKSYQHGDSKALLDIAAQLEIIDIINKYIPINKTDQKQNRNGLSVGASLLLIAVGRVCRPKSKMSWYQWCHETS